VARGSAFAPTACRGSNYPEEKRNQLAPAKWQEFRQSTLSRTRDVRARTPSASGARRNWMDSHGDFCGDEGNAWSHDLRRSTPSRLLTPAAAHPRRNAVRCLRWLPLGDCERSLPRPPTPSLPRIFPALLPPALPSRPPPPPLPLPPLFTQDNCAEAARDCERRDNATSGVKSHQSPKTKGCSLPRFEGGGEEDSGKERVNPGGDAGPRRRSDERAASPEGGADEAATTRTAALDARLYPFNYRSLSPRARRSPAFLGSPTPSPAHPSGPAPGSGSQLFPSRS